MATRDEVLNAYATTPGATANPDEAGINYWMGSGLGNFAQTVADINAQKNAVTNAPLANATNAAVNGPLQASTPAAVIPTSVTTAPLANATNAASTAGPLPIVAPAAVIPTSVTTAPLANATNAITTAGPSPATIAGGLAALPTAVTTPTATASALTSQAALDAAAKANPGQMVTDPNTGEDRYSPSAEERAADAAGNAKVTQDLQDANDAASGYKTSGLQGAKASDLMAEMAKQEGMTVEQFLDPKRAIVNEGDLQPESKPYNIPGIGIVYYNPKDAGAIGNIIPKGVDAAGNTISAHYYTDANGVVQRGPDIVDPKQSWIDQHLGDLVKMGIMGMATAGLGGAGGILSNALGGGTVGTIGSGAILGGANSALQDENILKGAVTGGLGAGLAPLTSGITSALPAGTDPMVAKAVASGLTGAGTAALTGGDVLKGGLTGAAGSILSNSISKGLAGVFPDNPKLDAVAAKFIANGIINPNSLSNPITAGNALINAYKAMTADQKAASGITKADIQEIDTKTGGLPIDAVSDTPSPVSTLNPEDNLAFPNDDSNIRLQDTSGTLANVADAILPSKGVDDTSFISDSDLPSVDVTGKRLIDDNIFPINIDDSRPFNGNIPSIDITGKRPVDETIPSIDITGKRPVDENIPSIDITGKRPVDETIPSIDITGKRPVDETIPSIDITGKRPVDETIPSIDITGKRSVDETIPSIDITGKRPVDDTITLADTIPSIEVTGKRPVDDTIPSITITGKKPVDDTIKLTDPTATTVTTPAVVPPVIVPPVVTPTVTPSYTPSNLSSITQAAGPSKISPQFVTLGKTGKAYTPKELKQLYEKIEAQKEEQAMQKQQDLNSLEVSPEESAAAAPTIASLFGFADGGTVSSSNMFDPATALTGLANAGLPTKFGSPNVGQIGKMGTTYTPKLLPQLMEVLKSRGMTFADGGEVHDPNVQGIAGIGGLAHGGKPALHYHGAPEGHNPEFVTGTTGHYVQGKGTGQSDDIPAMLADGEFVLDAETVSALGDGSNKAGAAILDAMREAIRKHKRSAPLNKIPPAAKSPLDYIKEGMKMKGTKHG